MIVDPFEPKTRPKSNPGSLPPQSSSVPAVSPDDDEDSAFEVKTTDTLQIVNCTNLFCRKKLQRLNIKQHSYEMIIKLTDSSVFPSLLIVYCGKFRIVFYCSNLDVFYRSCFLGVVVFPLSSVMMGKLDCHQTSYADIVWYEFLPLRVGRAFVSSRRLLCRIRFCLSFVMIFTVSIHFCVLVAGADFFCCVRFMSSYLVLWFHYLIRLARIWPNFKPEYTACPPTFSPYISAL